MSLIDNFDFKLESGEYKITFDYIVPYEPDLSSNIIDRFGDLEILPKLPYDDTTFRANTTLYNVLITSSNAVIKSTTTPYVGSFVVPATVPIPAEVDFAYSFNPLAISLVPPVGDLPFFEGVVPSTLVFHVVVTFPNLGEIMIDYMAFGSYSVDIGSGSQRYFTNYQFIYIPPTSITNINFSSNGIDNELTFDYTTYYAITEANPIEFIGDLEILPVLPYSDSLYRAMSLIYHVDITCANARISYTTDVYHVTYNVVATVPPPLETQPEYSNNPLAIILVPPFDLPTFEADNLTTLVFNIKVVFQDVGPLCISKLAFGTYGRITDVEGLLEYAAGATSKCNCYHADMQVKTFYGKMKAVKNLKIGDILVDYQGKPVKINKIFINMNHEPMVLVQKHAFAKNVPNQDVILTPDHRVFMQNMNKSIRHFVNNKTIKYVNIINNHVYQFQTNNIQDKKHTFINCHNLMTDIWTLKREKLITSSFTNI